MTRAGVPPTASLTARVAIAAAASIAMAGLVVAVVGVLLADLVAQEREDTRLDDAAATLAIELLEAGADPHWVAEDETRELAGTGISVSIYRDDDLVAGAPLIDRPAVDACITSAERRACAVRAGDLLAVASRPQAALAEQHTTSIAALALAVALTALLGSLVARRVARWSVAPLARLTERVARLDAGATELDLGASEGVAEVDALRDALATVLRRLSVALSHSQRFAADAAHELRTPLTTMQAELELLAEHVPADDAAAVAHVRRTTERLAVLVERLLVLARPDAAAEVRELVDLGDLVEDLVLEMPDTARARVTFEPVAGEALLVRGDAALLRSMIGCALENALKFSGEGAVTVRVLRSGDELVVEVDDEGPGVPPAERESLFLSFRRSARAREAGIEGHGIGLSLVAHVASLHHGRASFEDGAKGARLRITLAAAN